MTTLFLLRHAATGENELDPPVLQGCRSNSPLSASGFAQAAAASRILSQVPLAHVYSSPLTRAVQTASVIAEPHGVPVERLDQLREVDVGDWEGLSWAEIQQQQPEACRGFLADPGSVPYAGGESYGDLLRRAKPAVWEILARHEGQSIALVAHQNVNRVLLADLLGLPLASARRIHLSNCGISIIRWNHGNPVLVTMNIEPQLFESNDR